MAQQGSGLGKGPDGDSMQDQTSYNARSGAAKHVQTNFPVHPGMTDQQRAMAGISPADAGSGPDASSPNPMDSQSVSQRGKSLRKQPSPLQSSWGMKDANGKGVDENLGGRVLGEAILSGSAHIPSSPAFTNTSPRR